MHDKVLPGRSRKLLAGLEALNSPELEGWTLAGGTGLALHVGHRVSEDFDFFKVEPFDGDRQREIRYIMFGPGVSTMPRQTSAKPSNADVWGMTGLAWGCTHF